MTQIDEFLMKKLLDSENVGEAAFDDQALRITHESLNQKYAFPASKKLANVHKRAIRFGGESINSNYKCACCLKEAKKKTYGICEGTFPKDISKKASKQEANRYFDNPQFSMNSGAAMFFFFVKMAIVYLIIHSGIVQIYNILTNVSGQDNPQGWVKYSLANKSSNLDKVHNVEVLGVVLVGLSIVFFLLVHKIKYLIWKKIDVARQTEDDYSILVYNIPIFPQRNQNLSELKMKYDEQLSKLLSAKLHDWLYNQVEWDNLSKGTIQYDYRNRINGPDVLPSDAIKSISLCYDIGPLERLKNIRKQMMKKHTDNYQKILKENPDLVHAGMSPQDRFNMSARQYAQKKAKINAISIIPQQIKIINQCQLMLIKQIFTKRNFVRDATQFLGCAFVSFKYQHYRDKILEIAETNPESLKIQGSTVHIREAYHPTEVLWANLSISNSDRWNRKIVSIMILSLVLLFSFGLILGIYLATEFLENILTPTIYFQINLLSIVILFIIGWILQLIIYALVVWEKHRTITDAKLSLVMKIVISQFINNALIYFIVFEVRGGKFSDISDRIGLINQISWLLVISANLQIFFNILNLGDLYRRVYLWVLYRRYQDQVPCFQETLNLNYQFAEFDIAQRYSYYIVQLFTASFYAYLVPIGIPTLVIVFFIQFWIQKLNLFKRSSMKYVVNYQLTKNLFRIFEFSGVVFSVGMLIFSTKIHEQVQVFPIIALGISIVYVLLVNGLPNKIKKPLFESYVQLEPYDYDENIRAGKFQATYWTQNPFTKFLDEHTISCLNKPVNYCAKTKTNINPKQIKMGGRRSKKVSPRKSTEHLETMNDQ